MIVTSDHLEEARDAATVWLQLPQTGPGSLVIAGPVLCQRDKAGLVFAMETFETEEELYQYLRGIRDGLNNFFFDYWK